MRNSTQSFIRKTLYFLLLLGLVFLIFGAGKLPAAYAQGVMTETPTLAPTGTSGTPQASSPSGLVVSLSADSMSFGAANDVILHVSITNLNTASIKILKQLTPADGENDSLFTVTRDGQLVSYIGKVFKRPAPSEQDYITLGAGESLTGDVNLSAYYDTTVSGNYAITYDVASEHLYAQVDHWQYQYSGHLTSNTLNLNIEGRPSPFLHPITIQSVSGATGFTSCGSSQQSALLAARTNASTYAARSLLYLSDGILDPQYTTWFGLYNSSRYTTVKNHFNSISSAMDTASINFDCSCTDPSTYSYVYPSLPYNIYMCGAYWVAPSTGTDSQAGVLIHEMSHFFGTDDYVYGQSDAQSLAISNPGSAIWNADNHEYFAEGIGAIISGYVRNDSGVGISGVSITGLPQTTTTNANGFYAARVDSGWSGTVTPVLTNYTFTPSSQSYTNVTSNQSQDFTGKSIFTTGKYDDTDGGWKYTGSWVLYSGTGPYNGTVHYTTVAGDSASFTFSGTKITLSYSAYKDRGKMDIYLDGVKVATLNEYANVSSRLWQQSWTVGALAYGTHTLKLVNAGGGSWTSMRSRCMIRRCRSLWGNTMMATVPGITWGAGCCTVGLVRTMGRCTTRRWRGTMRASRSAARRSR